MTPVPRLLNLSGDNLVLDCNQFLSLQRLPSVFQAQKASMKSAQAARRKECYFPGFLWFLIQVIHLNVNIVIEVLRGSNHSRCWQYKDESR